MVSENGGSKMTVSGVYFIAIGTQNREPVFGEIVEGQVQLNVYGEMVVKCWDAIPSHFSTVLLDSFMVMPNRVHGILLVANGKTNNGPLLHLPLGVIVGSFKSAATRRVNEIRKTPGQLLWQPSYHERAIRTEVELLKMRQYLQENPMKLGAEHMDPFAMLEGFLHES